MPYPTPQERFFLEYVLPPQYNKHLLCKPTILCQDITCDSSVIVLNGDDILIGDCDTITHQGNNQTIWKEDQVL